MSKLNELINILDDGKANAIHARKLEETLNMGAGQTQEPTRDLVREAIINEEIPIGSTTHGFFLIDTEDELIKVVEGFEQRINGLQKRIAALKKGWEHRIQSRKTGDNWPK